MAETKRVRAANLGTTSVGAISSDDNELSLDSLLSVRKSATTILQQWTEKGNAEGHTIYGAFRPSDRH